MGTRHPIVMVVDGDTTKYCSQVIIKGPSKVMYDFDNPLPSGAHAWIETDGEIELIGEE